MVDREDKKKISWPSLTKIGFISFSAHLGKAIGKAVIKTRNSAKDLYSRPLARLLLKVTISFLVVGVLMLFALRLIPDTKLKSGAQVMKYVLVALTTAVSIYSLREDTVEKATDPQRHNRFKPAGITYLFYLIVLAMLTIAAARLDDVADNRLRILAEEKGNEQFKESLKAANSELASHLSQQVTTTMEQLEFASVPVERFYVDVEVPGVTPSEESMNEEDSKVAAKLKGYQQQVCANVPPKEQLATRENDCKKAFDVGAAWWTSKILLKHWDPGEHLLMVMTFTFNAFNLEAKTDQCDAPEISERYRCLRAEVRSKRGWNPWKGSKWAETKVGSGFLLHGDVLTLGFGFERDELKSLFPESDFYGRDASLKYIELGVCDQNNRPPDESEYVKKFNPPLQLDIHTTAFEKTTQQQDKLRRVFKRDERGRNSLLCRDFIYFP